MKTQVMKGQAKSEVREILSLVGKQIYVIHGPGIDDDSGASGGGDLDCVVNGHDFWWPLRLGASWRVCQCLRYDSTGWYWVVEHNGETIAIDVLDDKQGIGRYGFPTALLFEKDRNFAAMRGAYMATKRLRKRIDNSIDWQHVGRNASADPNGFTLAMQQMLGSRVGAEVARVALAGEAPTARLVSRALMCLRVRRMRTPRRLTMVAVSQALRVLQRLVHPSGLLVVVVGPDGAGKSTLADALMVDVHGAFRRSLRLHWRPGLLPGPGRLLRREPGDSQAPHGRPAHGRLVSNALLLYYWIDFFLGTWIRLWPVRVRSGLIVVERGWFDIAVDPRRYRLNIAPLMARALGFLLPRPDLVFVLHAPPHHLIARKQELSMTELRRQLAEWPRVLPPKTRRKVIDAAQHCSSVQAEAREATLRLLEARTTERLGAGWVALPNRKAPRWWIPRAPGTVAAAGLRIYQPVTRKGRLVLRIAGPVAHRGGFRLTQRGPAPPQPARELIAPHLPPGGRLAMMRANHDQRFIALLINADGQPVALAKVALGADGQQALQREAEAIQTLGTRLPAPLSAPDLVACDPGVLITGAVSWTTRKRPWEIPIEVATALGAFFHAGVQMEAKEVRGPAHGDCAPWNLLETRSAWVLVDWEEAKAKAPPFFDPFHYLIQASSLLGRPAFVDIVNGILGKGSIGCILRAYADAAGLDLAEAPHHLLTYLQTTSNLAAKGHPSSPVADSVTRRRLLTWVKSIT